MNDYTKGEWKVETDQFGSVYIIACEEDRHSLVADIQVTNDNAEANAHLIAAAPAMYEALKKMLSVWCCKDLHRTQYERVIKALAKAEGEQ